MDSNHQPSDLESGTLPIGVTDACYCIPNKIPTCNLRFRKTLLYAVELWEYIVYLDGFEPPTLCFVNRRSNPLSYKYVFVCMSRFELLTLRITI